MSRYFIRPLQHETSRLSLWFPLGLPACLLLILSSSPGTAASTSGQPSPTLDIFPSQVIDNVKETGETAKALESDLQGVIRRLDEQQQLYEESKCEGAVEDQGCKQLQQEMANTYAEMLDIMADQLPKMRRSVAVTRNTLQQRIASELGHKRAPEDLQQVLRNNSRNVATSQRTRVRREGMRLSDRFQQYYRLISQNSQRSLALIGAEMYVDLDETSRLIELTEQQIRRSRLVTNLSQSFGTITPEMRQTVDGVKRTLFGDFDTEAADEMAPPEIQGARDPEFCSELDPNC